MANKYRSRYTSGITIQYAYRVESFHAGHARVRRCCRSWSCSALGACTRARSSVPPRRPSPFNLPLITAIFHLIPRSRVLRVLRDIEIPEERPSPAANCKAGPRATRISRLSRAHRALIYIDLTTRPAKRRKLVLAVSRRML